MDTNSQTIPSAHSITASPDEVSAERIATLKRLNMAGWQGLNETIYGVQNRKHFSDLRIVTRMSTYFGLVHKAVRKNNNQCLPHHLCVGFSWTLALANNLDIDLEKEVWKKFPGVCPYCAQKPCLPSCNTTERPSERKELQNIHAPSGTFNEFQKMLAEMYPNNKARKSAGHLLEETTEVNQAMEHWLSERRNMVLFNRIITELVDVIAQTCAVASCKRLNISTEMAKIFGNGCPRCHNGACICEYTSDVAPSIR